MYDITKKIDTLIAFDGTKKTFVENKMGIIQKVILDVLLIILLGI